MFQSKTDFDVVTYTFIKFKISFIEVKAIHTEAKRLSPSSTLSTASDKKYLLQLVYLICAKKN